MDYSTGQRIEVGDRVVADGMAGLVVADFETREFLEGYERWDMPTAEMIGGGTLSCGVMIKTEECGLIHYAEEDEGIVRVDTAA